MVSFTKQLSLLFWKAYVIRKKKKLVLLVEVLVPLILFLLVVLIRTRDFTSLNPYCHYDAKALPSAGLLPFLHGFLCSLSNKCHNTTTTGDEQYNIHDDKRESIIIELAHNLTGLLAFFGKVPNTVREMFKLIALLIHHWAHPDDGFTEARIPFSLLFRSPQDMNSILGSLGFNDSEIPAFQSLYFSSYGPICLASEAVKIGRNEDYGDQIEMFCNSGKLDLCFDWSLIEGPRVDLCKITKSQLAFIYLFSGDSFDVDGLLFRVLNYLTSDQGELQGLKEDLSTIAIMSEISKIREGFGENWMDNVFCGSFNDSVKIDSPVGPKSQNNEVAEMTKSLSEFVQKISPARHRGNTSFCDEIRVNDKPHCNNLFLNIDMLKRIIQGYILVSPDIPLTRRIVGELDEILKQFNYWKDVINDLGTTADDLQNALHHSDITLAVKNILQMINVTETEAKAVMDLLDDSSNENGIFIKLKKVSKGFINSTDCIRLDRIRYVNNESDMERVALCLSEYDNYMAGIVFPDFNNQTTNLPEFIRYKIRYQHQLIDGTFQERDIGRILSRDRPLFDLKYISYGFVYLQDVLERSLIKEGTNMTIETGIRIQQEPYPCVVSDSFDITFFLSLFIVLSWMTPACLLVKNIVHEKEMRLKEMMRIMGMGDVIHWLVWAIQTLLMNTIAIVLIVFMLKFGNILKHTSLGILFIVMFPFATACAAQCVFMSTFFSRANLATPCTSLLFFVFFIPFFLSFRAAELPFIIITLSLPQSAIGYAFTIIALANYETDASFYRVLNMEFIGTDLVFYHILIALLVDTIVYSLAAWYISAVFPGDYGIPQPFYFFLTKRYWIGMNGSNNGEVDDDAEEESSEKTNGNVAIKIQHLTKVYDNNTRALDDMHVNFYENQITGFLGHNGAGKTTTMSILCGLYTPTSGTILVYGMDIRTDIEDIRKTLGICPQHNILFNDMTVEEQLYFYGALKNIPKKDLDKQVETMLEDVGLKYRRHYLANQLSGGMKRKLCIGIALIGGSKLVILDEPTAGIDAHARRSIWSLLEKHKPGRTIILSTHHMDEAQILSDRIVIVSEGKLKAAGSMNFLKGRFASGYTLITELKANNTLQRSYDLSEVKTGIYEILEGAGIHKPRLVEESSASLSYRIPIQTNSTQFQPLFSLLSVQKENLYIDKFALSGPSLQDVFLAAAPQKDIHLKKDQGILDKVKSTLTCRARNYVINDRDEAEECMEPDQRDLNHPQMSFINSKRSLRFQQFKALLVKRVHILKRSSLSIIFELLLPVFIFFAAEIYAKYQLPSQTERVMNDQKPLPFDSSLYGDGVSRYIGVWNEKHQSWRHLDGLIEAPGPGLRCMDPYPLNGFKNRLDNKECQYTLAPKSIYPNIESVDYNVPMNFSCDLTEGWQCSQEFPISDLQILPFNTTEILYNLIGRNISQYRMSTFVNTSMFSYGILGGWEYGQENPKALDNVGLVRAKKGLDGYVEGLALAAEKITFRWEEIFNRTDLATSNDTFLPENITLLEAMESLIEKLDSRELVKVWFNNKAWAGAPINLNTYYNAVLRSVMRKKNSSIPSDQVGIFGLNHPMVQSAQDVLQGDFLRKVGTLRVIMIILIVSVIIASFSMLLVEENQSKSRHLQRIFGVPSWLYYATNLLYDFMLYVACVLLLVVLLTSIGMGLFVYNGEAVIASFLLFTLFGLSTIPLVYLFQYAFSVPSLSFGVQSIGLFLVGVTASLTVLVLENMRTDDPALKTAYEVCSKIFLIIPMYNLAMSIYRMTLCYNMLLFALKYIDGIGRDDLKDQIPLPSLFKYSILGRHLIALLGNVIVYNIVCLLFEYRDTLIKWKKNREKRKTRELLHTEKKPTDNEVRIEQELVQNLEEFDDYGLVVRNLAKSYDGKSLAVKGVSFAVPKGECFGLLGVNGAGKTTTFSMLTGFLDVGSGDIIVDGEDRSTSNSVSFRNVGYCPQFDALFPKLTAFEHLVFYAKIRGVNVADIQASVLWAVEHMQLKPYAREIAKSYSGGNRRKLSAAIAIITDPNVVLLDEPSAGMDPRSQKFMWDLITELKQNNRTVVITSHSMEECEALCNRTAIMVQGSFYCLGTIQSLKEKFGGGYTLTVKLENDSDVKKCQLLFQNTLPQAKCTSLNLCSISFSVPISNRALVDMFEALKAVEIDTKVLDFSVFQTTLDDVFVSLAENAASGKAFKDTNLNEQTRSDQTNGILEQVTHSENTGAEENPNDLISNTGELSS
ncbi:unnamed protein product [Bursaphelenchus xylophilus]|uniref:(pine wood nematode) hypothetical protein n=1 Tax=Bursaphelenchus xylophilus TaxID=6326 RepID=A0A7I8XCK7_BURXY|nr:unnamed protein product [Bursaphelenchus xylophilus]CAG9083939.1 unnamed protein product [Bursaphelenchus xylophilus]